MGVDQGEGLTRRDFLKKVGKYAAALGVIGGGAAVGAVAAVKSGEEAASRSHGLDNSPQQNSVLEQQAQPVVDVKNDVVPQDKLTTDVQCAPVEDGGSVSQAVADADPGAWSSTMEHDVQIDRAGKDNDQTMSLQDAMDSNPPVQPGDNVCVGPSGVFGQDKQ